MGGRGLAALRLSSFTACSVQEVSFKTTPQCVIRATTYLRPNVTVREWRQQSTDYDVTENKNKDVESNMERVNLL